MMKEGEKHATTSEVRWRRFPRILVGIGVDCHRDCGIDFSSALAQEVTGEEISSLYAQGYRGVDCTSDLCAGLSC